MKLLILSIIVFLGISLASLTGLYMTPNYFYNKIVNQNLKTEWYSLDRYSKKYLKPADTIPFSTEKFANEDLWSTFHFGDLYIPLPVKNPFYFVVANLNYNKQTSNTKLGISILNASNEKISDIYFLPNSTFPNFMASQKLFELPIVRKQIALKTADEVWEDAFTKNITNWNIGYDEMAYNLYLLEFRSKLLKTNILKFGFLNQRKTASIEFDYKNKDYKGELFLSKRGNQIYSFIIISRKKSKEAELIRYKMIKDMGHVESSPALTDIIFKEFKGLNYKEQVDHQGMLFLLSAWSHNNSRKQILEKMIFYLERGFKNQNQLEPIYRYYYKRYGKVFSQKDVRGLNLNPELKLQINIESEKKKEINKRNATKIISPNEKQISIEEEFDNMIDRSMKAKIKKSKSIRLD